MWFLADILANEHAQGFMAKEQDRTTHYKESSLTLLGTVMLGTGVDIAIHWGVLHYLREDMEANAWVPATAIFLDLLVLGGFVLVKLNYDPFVIGVAVATMIVIAIAEKIFLKSSAGTR